MIHCLEKDIYSGLVFNPFLIKPWFLPVCSTIFENTVGKGEIAH